MGCCYCGDNECPDCSMDFSTRSEWIASGSKMTVSEFNAYKAGQTTMRKKMAKDWIDCCHNKENPNICPCSNDCICRTEGCCKGKALKKENCEYTMCGNSWCKHCYPSKVKAPSEASGLSAPEPPPQANNLPAVWSLVIKDMADRDAAGAAKYGVRLQPFNGRKSLRDAYQEALDLVVYLRQAIYETEGS